MRMCREEILNQLGHLSVDLRRESERGNHRLSSTRAADWLDGGEDHLTPQHPVPLGDISPVHPHFGTCVDTMQSMWPIRGENRALSVMSKQRSWGVRWSSPPSSRSAARVEDTR